MFKKMSMFLIIMIKICLKHWNSCRNIEQTKDSYKHITNNPNTGQNKSKQFAEPSWASVPLTSSPMTMVMLKLKLPNCQERNTRLPGESWEIGPMSGPLLIEDANAQRIEGGGVILGEVKARPKDIISFSLDYISKSKVQTSNPSSSPISLDTPARPAD